MGRLKLQARSSQGTQGPLRLHPLLSSHRPSQNHAVGVRRTPEPKGPSAVCPAHPLSTSTGQYSCRCLQTVPCFLPPAQGVESAIPTTRGGRPRGPRNHPAATTSALQRAERSQHLPWSPFFPLSSVGWGHLVCLSFLWFLATLSARTPSPTDPSLFVSCGISLGSLRSPLFILPPSRERGAWPCLPQGLQCGSLGLHWLWASVDIYTTGRRSEQTWDQHLGRSGAGGGMRGGGHA